jgi:hypothetical protein
VERFFQSGVALTKANTGLPETKSSRWRVFGVAPAGWVRRVTTPLEVVVDDEQVVAEPAPDAEPPETLPPEAPEPPPPDGKLVADGEGEGNGVFVGVGVGVGVGGGVGVAVVVGEGEGLPESPEPVGSPSLAYTAAAISLVVSAAYVVVAVPPAWLDAGASAEASEVDESALEVVADGELVEEELDEELAAPPPRAIDVVPLAELRAKSAETVCEMVPLVTLVVR